MAKSLTAPDLNQTIIPQATVPSQRKTDFPIQEIVSVNSSGKVIRETCKHSLIPGLDASFCKVCDIWWVDQPMRDALSPPRKGKQNGKKTGIDKSDCLSEDD